MDVGISLPTMAPGYTAATTRAWAPAIDAGPFTTLSTGERITFGNPDWLATLSAAAVLTERVRLFANLVVLPAHPVAVVAKQLATLDQLCDGRLTVGVGVGGRGHDFRAAERPQSGRHATLDAQVDQLRRLWSGESPFERADPVGPAPVQDPVPLLAGAMGPKALARAAQWADGVSGFDIAGDVGDMATSFRAAEQAWADAGRDQPPRKVNGCFYVLDGDDERAQATLHAFVERYLHIFGAEVAVRMAANCRVASADALRAVIDGAAERPQSGRHAT
ncbi:MAG TPA: LLM class flavin-dependent oxidoreductase, partial [Acidimicrobiales bacterium]|nr:LLM class flavin-dependent oxidoreductase [Acidimicrobiales bacterium]